MQLTNEILKDWQTNPLECTYALFIPEGQRLYKEQEEIIKSAILNPETYVKSYHGGGKTFTAALTVLTFLFVYPNSKVITTAPSWVQVRHLLWVEINKIWKNSPAYQLKLLDGYSPLETSLELGKEWFAIGLSPKVEKSEDAVKRFTGFHAEDILVVFDEGPAVHPKVWIVKDTLLTSKNAHFLAIGNPVDSSGDFYKGFQNSAYNRISLNIFENPNFKDNKINSLEDLRKIRKLMPDRQQKIYQKMEYPFPALTTPKWAVGRLIEWGEDSPLFKSRVLSEFPEQASDALISLAYLEQCKNELIPSVHSPKVLACDPARFGDDDTVVMGFANWKEDHKEKHNGWDLIKTSNKIIFLVKERGYQTIVIDEVGIGSGIVDYLRQQIGNLRNIKIFGVNFGAKPSGKYQETCANLVTELFSRLKILLENKEIGINDTGKLFAQVTNRKYEFNNKGQMIIEPKDKYKERTGQGSPDECDALLLCVYGLCYSTMARTMLATEARENIGGDW